MGGGGGPRLVDMDGPRDDQIGNGGGGLVGCGMDMLTSLLSALVLEPMVNDLWMLFRAEWRSRMGWPAALKES